MVRGGRGWSLGMGGWSGVGVGGVRGACIIHVCLSSLVGRKEKGGGVGSMEGFTFQHPGTTWAGLDYTTNPGNIIQSPTFTMDQRFIIGMLAWKPGVRHGTITISLCLGPATEDAHVRAGHAHPTTPTTPHHFPSPHQGHFPPPPSYPSPSPTTPTAFHMPPHAAPSQLVLHQAPNGAEVVSDP